MTGGEAPVPYGHHDGGALSRVKVRAGATWPASKFAENLAIDSRGAVFVSLHSHNRIDRYDPATGRIAPFADRPADGPRRRHGWLTVVDGRALSERPGLHLADRAGRHGRTLGDLPDAI